MYVTLVLEIVLKLYSKQIYVKNMYVTNMCHSTPRNCTQIVLKTIRCHEYMSQICVTLLLENVLKLYLE